jgi:hypothetical protein
MNRMLSIWMICTAAVLGVVILVKGIYYDHGSFDTWSLFFAMVLVVLGQASLDPTRARVALAKVTNAVSPSELAPHCTRHLKHSQWPRFARSR